ncbi:MAG: NAD(P)/FAD-dependent oxidoreductase [Prevotella sp.]|nr:NAD(P)/FAD-dependent oxidoreductase [Prevotella sp.]
MSHNIAIIGGGAAGFFAAITARECHPDASVTIFERSSRALAKVSITGGGRCNLTNSFEEVGDLKQVYPRGFNLMKRLFKQFDHHDVCRWFEEHGVSLVTQPDQCVFPRSQDAMSVVNCLMGEARRLGVKVVTNAWLERVSVEQDGRLRLHFKGRESQYFDRVAITTGGAPRTEQLTYLAELGHSLVQSVPALFTFNIKEPKFTAMMGTVVEDVVVSLPSTKYTACGPLLITHWGMSGPAILKLSSHAAPWLHEKGYRVPVAVSWVGRMARHEVEEQMDDIIRLHPHKQLTTQRPCGLPARLWQYILDKNGLPEDKRWSELGKKAKNKLLETLCHDIYQTTGKATCREEFVTCGGVALENIDYNTLESKRCPHLYFAGEVLDVDAITGGFNLQAAWTMGYVVGRNI